MQDKFQKKWKNLTNLRGSAGQDKLELVTSKATVQLAFHLWSRLDGRQATHNHKHGPVAIAHFLL